MQVRNIHVKELLNVRLALMLGLAILFGYALFSVFEFFRIIAVLSGVVFINYAIKYVVDQFMYSIEIELSTLATVAFAMTHGWFMGFFAGASTAILSYYLNYDLDERILFTIVAYFFAALIASFIPLQHVVIAGIILTIMINLLIFIGVFFLGEYGFFEWFVTAATSIPSNIFFFTHLAVPFIGLVI